jgi:hypothetical protein
MTTTSILARRVDLEAAWSEADHSEFCCLICATQAEIDVEITRNARQFDVVTKAPASGAK